MNGNRKKVRKWIIIGIILLALGGKLSGLVSFLLTGAIGLLLLAIVVIVLIKLARSDNFNSKKGYTEVHKTEGAPTKNPYSTNYNKEKAENYQKEQKVVKPAPTIDVDPEELKAVTPGKKSKQYTGDATIDKMIDEKDEAIAEMHRLNDAIEDETLSGQIDHLVSITDKIVAYIIEHPKKKKEVNKFFDYYLPTTLKLLNAYSRMDDTGISGTNIDGTKEKVEEMMSTALAAFDKQYDALYADEALDVSTDIKVMESMLKAEGLTADDITLSLK